MSPSQQPFPHQQIESISYPWSTQGFSSPLYLVNAPEGSLCFASLHPTLVPGHEASPRGTSPQFLPIPSLSKAQVRRPAMQIPPPTPSFFSSKLAESFPRADSVSKREREIVTYKDQLRFFLSKRFHSSAKRDPRAFLSINSLFKREDHFLSQGLLSESKLFFRKRTFIPKKQKSKKTW